MSEPADEDGAHPDPAIDRREFLDGDLHRLNLLAGLMDAFHSRGEALPVSDYDVGVVKAALHHLRIYHEEQSE